MALYFEGTSTGNKYEVGKTYEMGGKEYTAQKDGSFVREGTRVGTTDGGKVIRENDGGHSLTGSSQDPSVRWYASGADSLTSSRYSPGSAVSLAGASARSADSGFAAANPASGGMYQVAGPSGARFRAASGDYLRAAAWSGKDDPPQDLLFAGMHLRASPTFTNAELSEMRYSDFMSSVMGIPIFGADIGNTLAHKMGAEYYGSGRPGPELFQHRASVVTKLADDAAKDVGEAAIMTMMTAWDSLRSWGASEQAKEQRINVINNELREAWNLRDALEAAEAAKVETPRRSQQILGGMGVFGGL